MRVVKSGTTGIAALNIGGVTLHSWSGYSDGRYSREELLYKLQKDDLFEKFKTNIMETQCIIIDEISMMSCKMFEDVEYVSRCLRDSDRYFGGVTSDWGWRFFQLPPVPDHNTEDPGHFCFKSPIFN